MKRASIVALLMICAIVVAGCNGDDDEMQSTTTEKDKVPTGPPDSWYPYRDGSEPPVGAFPLQLAAAGCATSVVPPLQVHTTGNVRGALNYNTRPRGTGGFPETNASNTALGGFWKKMGFLNGFRWYQFKYQVEVTFAGPMADAVYGQMIADPVSRDSNSNDIEFHEDGPSNDSVGKKWTLRPGETKKQFPVVEIAGQTVRWIDAPGGYGVRMKNKKSFIIVYAGACERLTHARLFKLDVTEDANPTLTELTEAQLKAEVASFRYKVMQ